MENGISLMSLAYQPHATKLPAERLLTIALELRATIDYMVEIKCKETNNLLPISVSFFFTNKV